VSAVGEAYARERLVRAIERHLVETALDAVAVDDRRQSAGRHASPQRAIAMMIATAIAAITARSTQFMFDLGPALPLYTSAMTLLLLGL
jgi:hypothetical protein